MIPVLPLFFVALAVLTLTATFDHLAEMEHSRSQAEIEAYLIRLRREKRDVFAKLERTREKLGPKARKALEEVLKRFE